MRKAMIVLARAAALAACGYLVYSLLAGSGIEPRERNVFWISAVAALGGLLASVVRRQTTPVRVTVHVVVAVAVATFSGTLVAYDDPALLRFGHAVALGTGNAVTLGVAVWLAAAALQRRGWSEARPGTLSGQRNS
jgi:hypothetical protein